MTGLVDTQILLWSFLDDAKLTPVIRRFLTDESNTVCYSPVSLWEIAIKYGLGKLELHGFTPEDFFIEVERSFYSCLSFEPADAATIYKLPKLHKDPFDRMLLWQAMRHDCCLLSVDSSIKRYRGYGLRLLE
jgi:PIN domain nuclease of toxin-antitoxin system